MPTDKFPHAVHPPVAYVITQNFNWFKARHFPILFVSKQMMRQLPISTYLVMITLRYYLNYSLLEIFACMCSGNLIIRES
jgi:hypothetical protein